MLKFASALILTACVAGPALADFVPGIQLVGARVERREHDEGWWRRHHRHDRVCKTVTIRKHGETRTIRKCRGD